jgi:hypothetical protein
MSQEKYIGMDVHQATISVAVVTGFDDVSFVFLGDGGKLYMLPVFVLENVPDEIVVVQALHDNDDATGTLVVEPAA